MENSNFAGKLEIIKGEIVLNSTDETEIRVAQAVGIEVNPYIIVDGELTLSGANLALMDENGALTIPEGVTKIGNRVFHAKKGMTEIILPDSLKEISYCTGLTTIYIPNSVEKINNDAFYYDSNLMRIQIDNTPNSIEGAPWGAPIGDRAVEWLRQ